MKTIIYCKSDPHPAKGCCGLTSSRSFLRSRSEKNAEWAPKGIGLFRRGCGPVEACGRRTV